MPAEDTELSQRGISLKTEIISPENGLMSDSADITRPISYARVLENLQMTRTGVWTSRGIGYTNLTSQIFNGVVNNIAYHQGSNGTTYKNILITHIGNQCYLYDIDAATSTDRDGGLFVDKLSSIRAYDDQVVVCTFADAGREAVYWTGATGTNFQAVSTLPCTINSITYGKPHFCELFQTRLAYGRFEESTAGTAALDRRYVVILSKAGTAGTFTTTSPTAATDAGAFAVPARYGFVTGLKQFRFGGTEADSILLVGCERALCAIIGSNATNYSLVTISEEYGIVSHRAFAEIDGDLYFLATDGIRKLTGNTASGNLSSTIVSGPVRDLMARISTTYATNRQCFAVRHPSTNEIQWWLTIDSDTYPAHCVVMNYGIKQDGETKLLFSTKSGFNLPYAINHNGTMYGGTTDGKLTTHYSGDDYAGSTINWEYLSAPIGGNSPSQNASARKFVILTDGPNQAFTATAYTLTQDTQDITQWRTQYSKVISVTAPTITKLGTWVSGTTTTAPKFIDFNPPGSGRYWAVRLRAVSSGDHIDLVGVQSILTVGGLKQ